MSNSTLWTIAISIAVLGWMAYGIIKAGNDNEKFRAKGIKTEAQIVNKKNIGVSGTGNTKYEMDLEFETKNGKVTATTKRFFTPEELIKIMRKNTVFLYYMPEDPQQVYLVPEDME